MLLMLLRDIRCAINVIIRIQFTLNAGQIFRVSVFAAHQTRLCRHITNETTNSSIQWTHIDADDA